MTLKGVKGEKLRDTHHFGCSKEAENPCQEGNFGWEVVFGN